MQLKPPVCQDTSLCTSSCFGAPARATATSPWCWNEQWLQMHQALHSPGQLCQEQWLHQTPIPVQGSSSVHSSRWRKHQAETKSFSPSSAGSAHAHWDPTGFITFYFLSSLLDQHHKTSFFPQPSCLLILSARQQQCKSPTLLFEVSLGEDTPHHSQKHEDYSNTALW